MKPWILASLLGLSTIFACATLFSHRPRRIVLGWLAVGICQSAFFLVVGFEFLALLNVLFVAASATVLQLYSALFGTAASRAAERTRTRQDWIYGIGTGATFAAILVFALVSTLPETPLAADLATTAFAKQVLSVFPELPWILGVVLFLTIIATATVGRPGWKRAPGGSP